MELPVSGLDAFLEWQERLKRFESSGLSIAAFCRQEDIGRSQFAKWLLAVRGKRLKEATREKETRSPAFVPVTVKEQFIEIRGIMRDHVSAGQAKEAAAAHPSFEKFFWSDTTRGPSWIEARRVTFRKGLEKLYDEARNDLGA